MYDKFKGKHYVRQITNSIEITIINHFLSNQK